MFSSKIEKLVQKCKNMKNSQNLKKYFFLKCLCDGRHSKGSKSYFLFFWTTLIIPKQPFLVVDISYFFFNFFAFPDSSSVKCRGTFSLRTCVLSNKEVKYE